MKINFKLNTSNKIQTKVPIKNNALNRNRQEIAFKMKQFEIPDEQTKDFINADYLKANYKSKANIVYTQKAFLDSNANINHLKLTEARPLFQPDEVFYITKYNETVPDLVLKNNAHINELTSNFNNPKIKFICDMDIPRITHDLTKNSEYNFVLNSDINVNNVLKGNIFELYSFANADQINAKKCILNHMSFVKTINSDVVKINDEAGAKYINAVNTQLNQKSHVHSILSNNCELWNNSHAYEIYGRNTIMLHHNSTANKIKTDLLQMNDRAYAVDVSAKNTILLNNSKIKNLNGIENVKLKNNAIVNNIIMNGTHKPSIDIYDNAKITGLIKFEGATGRVNIHSTNNNINMDPFQIENGELFINDKKWEPRGFEKIMGMKELKKVLREDIINPLKYPEKYKKYGIPMINGLLLYGPPGCGKTYIVEALAEETQRNFISIRPSDIASIYQHEPAQKIAEKFMEAKINAPSLIFIDEAESIAPNRDKLSQDNPDYSEQVTELLQQLNNIHQENIVVIFASNEPQNIDKAIKRTGRLDKKIYVAPPDEEARKELLEMYSKNRPLSRNINFELIKEKTNHWTSSDIKALSDQAAKEALKNDELIDTKHYIEAMKQIKPSLTQEQIKMYQNKIIM